MLVPLAGAPHAEPARFSTLPLAGHRAFVVSIAGRQGKYDPKTCRTEIGQQTVELLDRKLASDELVRHLTSYIGDQFGRNRLIGCKLRIWESLDGGVTWRVYFTGRILQADLGETIVLRLTVRSMLAELGIDVFVGRPSVAITYVAASQYCPLGLSAKYGPLPETPGVPLTFVTADGAFSFNGNVGAATAAHTVTDALRAVVSVVPYYGQASLNTLITNEPTAIRLRCRFTTGAFAGTVREYRVRGAYFFPAGSRFTVRTAGSNDVLYGVSIAPLESPLDPFYAALPANGDRATVSVIAADTAPTSATPLRVDDVHPVTLFKHLLRGDFGYLNVDGTARRSVPIEPTSFSALEADTSFGVFRAPIEARAKLNAWAESQLCQIFQFGFRDTPNGEIEVFDARTPASIAGLPVLTDADCYAESIGWSQSSTDGITIIDSTTYLERGFTVDASVDVGALKTPNDLVAQTPSPELAKLQFREDNTESVLTLDCLGLRWFESEVLQGRARRDVVQAMRRRVVDANRGLYGSSPARTTIPARRTATVNGLRPGSLCIGTFSQLPDPATNRRGGTRLFRVVQASEQGLPITLELLDLGPSSVMLPPTLGALSAGADPSTQVTFTVTPNASGDPVVVEVAITTDAVTGLLGVPAAAWQVDRTVTATGAITISNLSSGRRVWVRVRSFPTGATTARLPSAYVSPATPFRDTTAPPLPGVITFSNVTERGATATWTNTSTALRVAVARLEFPPPPGFYSADYVVLPPGSTEYPVLAFPFLVNYVQVFYLDQFGAVGPFRSAGYTPTGAAPTAPTPTSLTVRTLARFVDDTGGATVQTGIGLRLLGVSGYRTQIFRSLTSGSGFTLIAEMPTSDGTPQDLDDPLPLDNVLRYYRAVHVSDREDPSAPTAEVSARPGVLR